MRAKKLLSLLLVFVMTVSCLPVSVWALETGKHALTWSDPVGYTISVKSNGSDVAKDTALTASDTITVSIGAVSGYKVTDVSLSSGSWATTPSGGAKVGDYTYTVPADDSTEGGTTVIISVTAKALSAVTFANTNITVTGSETIPAIESGNTMVEDETVTIAPKVGYSLGDVTVAKTGDSATTVTVTGNTSSKTFTMPAYPVTITATTNAAKYNVTLAPGAGTGTNQVLENAATHGLKYTLPECPEGFSKAGSVFSGWMITTPSGDTKVYQPGAKIDVTEATTLTAQWDAAVYTIKFDKNSETATGTMRNILIASGKTFGESGDVEVPDCEFVNEGNAWVGWNTDKNATAGLDFSTPAALTKDTTYYAIWAPSVTLTFDLGDAPYALKASKGFVDNAKAYVKDADVFSALPAFPGDFAYTTTNYEYAECWKLLGWCATVPTKDTPVISGSYTASARATLYAKWDVNYPVSYVGGDTKVTGNMDSYRTTVPAGTKFTLDYVDGFTYDNDHMFIGWKLNDQGALLKASEEVEINAPSVFYAQWTESKTLTFALGDSTNDGNGVAANGTACAADKDYGNKANVRVVEAGKSLPLPLCTAIAPAVSGKTVVFDGWKVGTTNTILQPNATYTPTANVTLTAQWKVIDNSSKVTVHFGNRASNNSFTTLNMDQVIEKGGVASKPTDPKTEGYLFAGWYKATVNDSGKVTGIDETEYNFASPVTADLYLIAYWDETYNVSFKNHAPTAVNDITGTMQPETGVLGEYTLPECGFKSAAKGIFLGWYLESDTSKTLRQPGYKINVESDVILVAEWAEAVTVTFDANGGKIDGKTTLPVKVQSGKTVTVPVDPELDGNRFNAWCTRTGAGTAESPYAYTAYDFTTPVTTPFILYATWSEVTFKVSFNKGASSATGTAPTVTGVNAKGECAKDYEITLPDGSTYTNAGYFFAGWKANNEGLTLKANSKYKVEKDVTFYAQWTPGIAVTFVTGDEKDGAPQIKPQTLKSGETATDPMTNDAVKEAMGKWANHTFKGWYADPNYTTTFDFSKAITANTTIYAKWEIAYAVTFNKGDNSEACLGRGETQKILAGKTFTLPDASKTGDVIKQAFSFSGHKFTGWMLRIDGKDTTVQQPGYILTPTADVELVAQWAVAYEVSFAMYGGSSIGAYMKNAPGAVNIGTSESPNYVVMVEKDQKYTLPECGYTDSSYAFKNWIVGTDTSKLYVPGDQIDVTKNIVLNAYFTVGIPVTFKYNYTDAPADVVVAFQSGTAVVVPESIERNGYRIEGWYTDAKCTTKYDIESTPVTAAITLYAKWEAAYTVSFNANGGTGTMKSDLLVAGEYELPECKFTRDGYEFAGWLVNNDKDNLKQVGNKITVDNDVTLYANWKEIEHTYTVSFNANGGTGAMDDVKDLAAGTKYALPECTFTAPEGKEFAGWLVNNTGDAQAVGTEIEIKADVTLYAQWKDKAAETQTAMPENVKATLNVKKGTVTVTWDAVEGATKYSVWRKAKGGEWSKIAKVSTTSYTDKDQLNADTKYYYCVKAQAPGLTASKHSEVTTDSRIITPLDPMTGVSAAVANGKITVSWTDNGAKYFTVYRYTKDGGWVRLPAAKKLAAGTTSFVDETAVAGTAYKYCVKSYNGTWSLKSNNTKAVKLTATTSMFAY